MGFGQNITYRFKNMSESEHIQVEYLTLKDKIENRIKDLQSKCFEQNQTKITDRSQISYHPMSSCHHLQSMPHSLNGTHCHQMCCNHSHNPDFIPSNFSCMSADRKSNDNFLINEALMENLKAQKQMNNNLRLLSDKISDISARRSETSNFMDENSSRDRKRTFFYDEPLQSPKFAPYERSKSENGSINKYSVRFKKAEFKSPNLRKKSKMRKPKMNFDYYNDEKKFKKKCPVHEHHDIMEAYESKVKNKEVYKDSTHRNKKHERHHLLSAFKQQEKSRKELLAKIAKNFFIQYGVN